MNIQAAREQSNHVQRTEKGSDEADFFIDKLGSGNAFMHFDKASEVGRVLRKVIYMYPASSGEFNVYLKNVI